MKVTTQYNKAVMAGSGSLAMVLATYLGHRYGWGVDT